MSTTSLSLFKTGEQIAEQVIGVFVDSLEKKNPLTKITTPLLGGSGFTFLCEIPTRDLILGGRHERLGTLKFVLKVEVKAMGENELLISAIFRRFFPAPETFLVPKKISTSGATKDLTLFFNEAREVKSSFPADLKKYCVILMPGLKACTFDNALREKEKILLRLPDEDFKRMLVTFGQIAIFDLLTGNVDRFIRFDSRNGPYFLKSSPIFNRGNIMLQIEGGRLLKVFCIDNCSDPELQDKEKAEDFSKERLVFGFFDDSSTLQELSVESSKEADGTITPEQRLDLLHQMFKGCIKSLPELAEHIQCSIINSIRHVVLQEEDRLAYANRFDDVIPILQGLNEGIKRLKNHLNDHVFYTEAKRSFSKRVSLLIYKNLSFLQDVIT